MKKLFLMFFLSVIPILPFLSAEKNVLIRLVPIERIEMPIRTVSKYLIKYEEVIKFIKQHEGFVETAYYCIGGSRTIGHGLVTKYIGKEFSDSITEEQSDSIIRWKIDWGIKKAKKKYSGLNKYQYLTISHLFFCKGVGGIHSHAIHNQLKRGYINKNTLLYYSKYEQTRNHYRKTRKFEWNLWNFKET